MNGKLKLNDLLGLSEEELNRTRIRFNQNNGENEPIEIFKQNPEELIKWNYWKSKPYKKGMISIGLVNMGSSRYLLFTVGEVISDKPEGNVYKAIQNDKYKELYGRVVISYKNKAQQLFRTGRIIDELEVAEILPSFYTGFEFPGYEWVNLTYQQLSTIINGNYPAYKNALERQKAIYVQTDTHTGKLYIGSATADPKVGMLLARWKSYVANGHGGNKDLKKIVQEKGFDYIKKYFTYTIIENFNEKTDDKYVRDREKYWKDVFKSKKFGYNKN